MAQDDTFEGLEDGAERLNETLGATATLVAYSNQDRSAQSKPSTAR